MRKLPDAELLRDQLFRRERAMTRMLPTRADADMSEPGWISGATGGA